MEKSTILHIGDVAICDTCGKDWTNNDQSGGFLFGSYAVCPDCAPKILENVDKYNERHAIKEFCPPNLSYWQWVLKLRGGDNTIKVTEWH